MRGAAAAIGRLRRQLSADALLDLGGRLGLWRTPRRWDARRWALVSLEQAQRELIGARRVGRRGVAGLGQANSTVLPEPSGDALAAVCKRAEAA
jgi:hypothetical protein